MAAPKKLDDAILDPEQVEVGRLLVDLIAYLNGPPRKKPRLLFVAKRLFDIAASLVAIILLAPLFLAITIAVKLETDGPAFFTQLRVGRNLRTFRILKFRTMHVGSADEPRPVWDPEPNAYRRPEGSEDARITRVGNFLRRWSLDELPQLFNILAGDMSVIGPRPLTIHESILIPRAALARYSMPAGLTGLAQVTCRELMISPKRFEQDVKYVESFSVGLEVEIFLKTFTEVVRYARKAKQQE